MQRACGIIMQMGQDHGLDHVAVHTEITQTGQRVLQDLAPPAPYFISIIACVNDDGACVATQNPQETVGPLGACRICVEQKAVGACTTGPLSGAQRINFVGFHHTSPVNGWPVYGLRGSSCPWPGVRSDPHSALIAPNSSEFPDVRLQYLFFVRTSFAVSLDVCCRSAIRRSTTPPNRLQATPASGSPRFADIRSRRTEQSIMRLVLPDLTLQAREIMGM